MNENSFRIDTRDSVSKKNLKNPLRIYSGVFNGSGSFGQTLFGRKGQISKYSDKWTGLAKVQIVLKYYVIRIRVLFPARKNFPFEALRRPNRKIYTSI